MIAPTSTAPDLDSTRRPKAAFGKKRASPKPKDGHREIRKAAFDIINQKSTTDITTKETTTSPRARTKESAKATKKASSSFSSCVVEEGNNTDLQAVNILAQEFKLSTEQTEEVHASAKRKGLGYVQEKAEIARTRPNPPGAFLAALRGDWKTSRAPQKSKVKRAAQPSGPFGWFEAQRELYPQALHYTVWANAPKGLQAEIQDHLSRKQEQKAA